MADFLQFLSSLAWPGAIIALALIFKSDLSEAVGRVKKAGIAGVELAEQQVAAPLASRFEKSGELSPLPNFQRTAAIAEVEKGLHTSLSFYKAEDRIDLLVGELAATRLTRHFESAWGIIFESQIRAVQTVAGAGGAIDISTLRTLYDAVGYPPEFSYEDWLNFPVAQYLARRVGDQIEITDLGRDFLMWLPVKGALRRSP